MKFLASLLAFAVAVTALHADADAGRRKKKRRSGVCGSVPAALRGGESAQRRHNAAADDDGLTRLESRDDLERFIAQGHLVEIGETASYYLDSIGGHDPKHDDLYRHARPWTKRFLDRELAAGHAKFGIRFKITSLVRTDAYQSKICRSGNAAAICGGAWWEESLHITGATVDISKAGMSCQAQKWMRARLVRLQGQGLVGAIEERGAFHVFVRKAYGVEAKTKAKKAKRAKKKAKRRKRRR